MTPDYKRLLVENVTTEVPLGTGIIIKGPSGSGKSSLLACHRWSVAFGQGRHHSS
jgi:ABC-type lipoprotein export system ATPase subunit